MTYKIKGEIFTGTDIDNECASIMGVKVEYPMFDDTPYARFFKGGQMHLSVYSPSHVIADAQPVIDKCRAELDEMVWSKDEERATRWKHMQHSFKCTRLMAACICLIHYNGDKT